MINIPKGTKDVLPDESYKWHYVEDTVRQIAAVFGASEIRTPVFEHTELFLRGVGDTTDIVNKEMYTFTDKGGRSVTLKPEGTAGVARSFIENGLASSAMPLKMYYITPVFRYERPQAGRLREHHQFGVEFYGSSQADTDAEVILLAYTVLSKLGLSVSLNINSMGCEKCRKDYNAALKDYLKDKLDLLCDTCRTRYEKNPLRILDCKVDGCKEVVASAPLITDYLCDDCRAHFERLKKLLDVAGLSYTVNPHIVRGLDYYTKTVFEFITTDLGSQGTVCGGGRYDNLISQLGGGSVPGVGFGMGIERLLMLMDAKGVSVPDKKPCRLFIAAMGDEAYMKAFGIITALRAKGVSCEIDHMARSVKAQFRYADKIGAEYVAAIGDNELLSGVVSLKQMSDGSVENLPVDGLIDRF